MFQLRRFQKDALEALGTDITAQKHVLCIAATGSGKSLIYEEAAAFPGRKTLLMTPLVALARQQFQRLKERGIPVTLTAGEAGPSHPPESGSWIMSPETLQTPSRMHTLSNWKPNLLVVDECHCLWDWGERFRPAFLLIPTLIERLGIPQSLWLTATLPYPAREELRKALPKSLCELGEFSLPPSLCVLVERVPWPERIERLIHNVSGRYGRNDPGMIFVATRADTIRLSRLLCASGRAAIAYHGGLSSEERRNIEKQVRDKNCDLIVCTSAFGMGMDYDHLKFILLWQSPTSLLSLVQLIGRVGRNRASVAEAIVFWDVDDFQLLEWTVANSERRRKELLDLKSFFSSNICRRTWLKHYFDQMTTQTQSVEKCGHCDICN